MLTPEEIVEANENGKKIIVQLAFYSVFTILLSVCALYRCPAAVTSAAFSRCTAASAAHAMRTRKS